MKYILIGVGILVILGVLRIFKSIVSKIISIAVVLGVVAYIIIKWL